MLAVVDEAGLAAVSLATVAARAGVSPGRVQYYFPTRESLLEAAFDHANALSSTRITALARPDPAARDLLATVLGELIPHDDASRTHLRVRQWFAAQALADDRIAARLRAQYAELLDTLAQLIEGAQRANTATSAAGNAASRSRAETRAEEARADAMQLLALAEGLAYHVLTGLHPATTARGQVLDAIVAAVEDR